MSDDIAGVSLNAPRESYGVTVPAVGRAVLRRAAPRYTLTLTLPASLAASLKTGGGATEVTLQGLGTGSYRGAPLAGDMRALIVEHRLLSRPKLLLERAHDGELDPDALTALSACREALTTAVGISSAYDHVRCDKCPGASSALRIPRSSPFYDYLSYLNKPTEDCAHVALGAAALSALARTYYELALEFAGVLAPDSVRAPSRFVLTPVALRAALRQWLLSPEARRRARDPWGSLYERRPRRAARAARQTRLSSEAWSQVPEGHRKAIAFAARAWRVEEDAPRFGLRGDAAEPFAPWEPADALAPREIAVMVPEEFRAPLAQRSVAQRSVAQPSVAQRSVAPPSPSPARSRRKAAPKAPAPPPAQEHAQPAAPPPSEQPSGRLYTMADLAALGHGPAAVKRMLKTGALTRESFGWYRFAEGQR